MASLPATYSPLYHSSAVLPDGRLIIEGGEYLLSADQTALVPSWTAQGSIYDPIANTWTPVAPPAFFGGFGPFPQTIGDAQSVILPNGTYMQADCLHRRRSVAGCQNPQRATPTGSNKFDINDEEGLEPASQRQSTHRRCLCVCLRPYRHQLRKCPLPRPAHGPAPGSTMVQLWDSAAACRRITKFHLRGGTCGSAA